MGLGSVHNCFSHCSFPLTVSPSSDWAFHGPQLLQKICVLQQAYLLSVVFFPGCRGISAQVPGAHPPPLASVTSVYRDVALVHSHASLSHNLQYGIIFPFLQIFLPRCPNLGCGFSCALSCGLKLPGTGCVPH